MALSIVIEFAPLFELSFKLSLNNLLVDKRSFLLFSFAAKIFVLISFTSVSERAVRLSTGVRSGTFGSKSSFNLYNTGSLTVSTRAYCCLFNSW